ERRNLQSVLDLMGRGLLNVDALTTHRFQLDKAAEAYEMISAGTESYVGIVFVGAGNYSTAHLLPHLKSNSDVRLIGLTSATGLNAIQKAERFGFSYCGTDIQPLLEDPAIDALFIGTRHSTHAEFTIRALNAGKHVFVEKPLVVTEAQLDAVIDAYQLANQKQPTGVMVGLNRRFAPLVTKLKEAFQPGTALQMIYRVNSGNIPTSTWLHEEHEGGGMLVGEMCHFIDLMQFICGQHPTNVYAQSLKANSQKTSD